MAYAGKTANNYRNKIGRRETFKSRGALSGENVERLYASDSGRMDGADKAQFDADCANIVYVVRSYATPIAWGHENRQSILCATKIQCHDIQASRYVLPAARGATVSTLRIDYAPTSRGYIGSVYRVVRRYRAARLAYTTEREGVADCIGVFRTQASALQAARELRDRMQFYNEVQS